MLCCVEPEGVLWSGIDLRWAGQRLHQSQFLKSQSADWVGSLLLSSLRFPLFLNGDFLTTPWLTPLLQPHARFTWQKTHAWCTQTLQSPTHSGGRTHQGSMFDERCQQHQESPAALLHWNLAPDGVFAVIPKNLKRCEASVKQEMQSSESINCVDLWRLMMWILCCCSCCCRCCCGILQLRLQPRCLLLAADDVTLFLDSLSDQDCRIFII